MSQLIAHKLVKYACACVSWVSCLCHNDFETAALFPNQMRRGEIEDSPRMQAILAMLSKPDGVKSLPLTRKEQMQVEEFLLKDQERQRSWEKDMVGGFQPKGGKMYNSINVKSGIFCLRHPTVYSLPLTSACYPLPQAQALKHAFTAAFPLYMGLWWHSLPHRVPSSACNKTH